MKGKSFGTWYDDPAHFRRPTRRAFLHVGVVGGLGLTLADGTRCDDGDRCSADTGDMCLGGVCLGGTARDCSTSGLNGAQCEPSDGLCCGKVPGNGYACR